MTNPHEADNDELTAEELQVLAALDDEHVRGYQPADARAEPAAPPTGRGGVSATGQAQDKADGHE